MFMASLGHTLWEGPTQFSFEGVNGTLRETHAARQLQEAVGLLAGGAGSGRCVKTSLCCMFAHRTLHFTSMPATQSPATSIFTDPN